MKIKEIPVGKRFLAKLMLGADVWVHAEYVKGEQDPARPGYYHCMLTAVEVLEKGFVIMQKQIKSEPGLTMNGEVDVYHEET